MNRNYIREMISVVVEHRGLQLQVLSLLIMAGGVVVLHLSYSDLLWYALSLLAPIVYLAGAYLDEQSVWSTKRETGTAGMMAAFGMWVLAGALLRFTPLPTALGGLIVLAAILVCVAGVGMLTIHFISKSEVTA